MGNKSTTENTESTNTFKPTSEQIKPEVNIQKNNSNQFYKLNPLELAKDDQGRLHPKWSQVVKKCQLKHKAKTDQYVQKIAEQTNRIGSWCINRYSENQTKLIECFEISYQPIKKIQKIGQQKIMGLGRTANICLLNNKKQDKCIEQVRKVLHGCLQETLKEMKKVNVQI